MAEYFSVHVPIGDNEIIAKDALNIYKFETC